MRYHYIDKRTETPLRTASLYRCNHPLYNSCTLFKIENRGLAVVQKKFNRSLKTTWWDCIDSRLAVDIENQEGFNDFLESKATLPDENGLYPTMSVRRVMWALRMKPLQKAYWEYEL